MFSIIRARPALRRDAAKINGAEIAHGNLSEKERESKRASTRGGAPQIIRPSARPSARLLLNGQFSTWKLSYGLN